MSREARPHANAREGDQKEKGKNKEARRKESEGEGEKPSRAGNSVLIVATSAKPPVASPGIIDKTYLRKEVIVLAIKCPRSRAPIQTTKTTTTTSVAYRKTKSTYEGETAKKRKKEKKNKRDPARVATNGEGKRHSGALPSPSFIPYAFFLFIYIYFFFLLFFVYLPLPTAPRPLFALRIGRGELNGP